MRVIFAQVVFRSASNFLIHGPAEYRRPRIVNLIKTTGGEFNKYAPYLPNGKFAGPQPAEPHGIKETASIGR